MKMAQNEARDVTHDDGDERGHHKRRRMWGKLVNSFPFLKKDFHSYCFRHWSLAYEDGLVCY